MLSNVRRKVVRLYAVQRLYTDLETALGSKRQAARLLSLACTTALRMLEFATIRAFYEFLQVPPPDEDFSIQRLEASQRLRPKLGAPVFHHRFYGISLQLTGNVHYQAGGQQRYMNQPFMFFSSPHQLTSWQLPTAAVVYSYHLVFTEIFLRRYPALAVLVSRLPFLQLGNGVPFVVDPADVTPLLTSY